MGLPLILAITVWQLPQRQLLQKKAAGGNASLTVPDSVTVNPGDQFDVPILVDTDGAAISGVDVALDFADALGTLSLVAIDPVAQATTSFGTFAPVNADGALDTVAVIAKANATGQVAFGAVIFDWSAQNLTNTFSGILGPANPLVVLIFQVAPSAATGQVTIRVNHTPGETTDTNLVDAVSVSDILAMANAMTVNISGPATPTSPPAETEAPEPTVTGTITGTGTPMPTVTTTPVPTPTPTLTVVPTPVVHCLPLGDVDCSGQVNAIDFSYVIAVYNTNDPKADFDGSQLVNALDISMVLANYGQTAE